MNQEQPVAAHRIALEINGETHVLTVNAATSLLDALRDHLDLTGTKEGCGEGDCGACTVLLGDKPVASCLLLAVDAQGKAITTVEGLARGGELSDLQQAFIAHNGLQCGYCTPGMLMAAEGLLRARPVPTRAEVQEALTGNLCRCTGYVQILDAVLDAARRRSGQSGQAGQAGQAG